MDVDPGVRTLFLLQPPSMFPYLWRMRRRWSRASTHVVLQMTASAGLHVLHWDMSRRGLLLLHIHVRHSRQGFSSDLVRHSRQGFSSDLVCQPASLTQWVHSLQDKKLHPTPPPSPLPSPLPSLPPACLPASPADTDGLLPDHIYRQERGGVLRGDGGQHAGQGVAAEGG